MTHNPILEELYAIREQLLADAGGDMQKYLTGVREREAASGRLLAQRAERAWEPDASLTHGCSEPAEPTADTGRY